MARIVPAILTDNKKDFRNRLKIACNLTKRVQIDIVDNRFAPFLGVICQRAVKKFAKTNFLEAHIMIENPDTQIEFYQKLGFKKIIPHWSALDDPAKFFAQKRSIALNPDEPVGIFRPYLNNIETVLIMGVVPGQMGQKFIPQIIDKIRQMRTLSGKIEIEVDGGVNDSNIKEIVRAGADIVVAGSAIYNKGNPQENFAKLNTNLT